MAFLPVNRRDMEQRGWDELDFLFVTGDAYVDHPSFGTAIITRVLEDRGYRIGICAQPNHLDPTSLTGMGVPRLGVLVSSGVVDSMVNHYTAAKRRRSEDRYSPGGKAGLRPDRALIRYCTLVRDQMGEIPLIIGGIEASLRRFAHYDYWSGKVRRSILQDSLADILVYGMGEEAIIEIADLLSKGVNIRKITSIRGTCVYLKPEDLPARITTFVDLYDTYVFPEEKKTPAELRKYHPPQDDHCLLLPSYNEVFKNKVAYAVAFHAQYQEQVPIGAKTLLQKHSHRWIVQNPPRVPLSEKRMDAIYALPYERRAHPMYEGVGGVPAIEEVRFSLISHRGCFGGCHFCAITFHQGRIVRHRSKRSLVQEAVRITEDRDFKGYIHDVGGPTANFYNPACDQQEKGTYCRDKSCLFPEICPSLKIDHTDYLEILREIRSIEPVKKVFIRSGIRFDYVMKDVKSPFLEEICRNHISGQLKVAPEHSSDRVLAAMGKSSYNIYRSFKEKYDRINRDLRKKQYLVPYLMSGHPGCTLRDAIDLAVEIKKNRVLPEQVQDFYPTPGTVSTAMYYTGIHPLDFEPVYIPNEHEKKQQRALLRFSDPKNRKLVEEALMKENRTELIGLGFHCLIRPVRTKSKKGE